MYRLTIILLSILLCNAAFSFATPADSVREKYVEEYPDRFYIKPVLTVRNLSLELESRFNKSTLDYRPNGNTLAGIGLYIFNLGFEVSFRLRENEKSTARFGETDYFDLQSNIYARRWGADIALQRYQGFYLNNPGNHFPSWQNNDPYPRQNDLEVRNVSANVFFLMNHRKFSYRSAYNQADRQKRSGGSVIVGINYLDQEIAADSNLIPVASRELFDLEEFRQADFSALGVLPGYTHSFIYNYFYLNLFMALGPAHVWSSYSENHKYVEKNQFSAILNIRAALGYNSPRWFAGLTLVNHTSNLLTDHLDISGESGNIKLFVGLRFREKGFMKINLPEEVTKFVKDKF